MEGVCYFSRSLQGPRNSIGPDIQHFILGSEGNYTHVYSPLTQLGYNEFERVTNARTAVARVIN